MTSRFEWHLIFLPLAFLGSFCLRLLELEPSALKGFGKRVLMTL